MSQELEFRVTAKVDEALAAVRQLGDETAEAMSQVKKANEKVVKAQEETTASARDLITGLSGVATSAFALYSAIDRVQDMQVSLDRANLAVKASLNAVEDAQRRYNAAVEKYGADSEQAKAAAEDLKLAQERYQVAVERAEMIQGNLNEAMVQSALTVIPTLITMVDSGVKAFQNFHAAVDIVNKVTAFLAANPLMAVIMAIGILIGVLITAYQTCEPFRNAINAIGKAIYDFFKPAVDAVIGALTWLWNNVVTPFIGTLKQLWDTITNNPILAALFGPITTIAYLIQHWDDVTKALGDTWNAVTNAISGFWNTYIQPIIDAIKAVVIAVITEWINILKSLQDAWNTVCSAISGFWDTYIKPIIDFIWNVIKGAFEFWINIIKSLGDVWNAVCSAISGFWDTYIKPIVDFIWSSIQSAFNSWIDIIKSLGDVWNAICNGISWAWDTFVKPVVDAVKWFADTIYSIFETLFGWLIGGSLWRDLCSGIVGIWNSVVMPLVDTVKGFVDSVIGAFNGLRETLSGIWNSIVSGVQNAWGSITSAISGAVSTATSAVSNWAQSVTSAMSGAWDAISNFISSICFAHAITDAVDTANKKLGEFEETVDGVMHRGLRRVGDFIRGAKERFNVFIEKVDEAEKRFSGFSAKVGDDTGKVSSAFKSVQADSSKMFGILEKNWDRMSEASKKAWTEYITGGTRGLDVLSAWADAVKSDVRYWILWLTKYCHVAEKAQGLAIPFPEAPPAIENLDKEIKALGITYEDFVKLVQKSGSAFEEAWLEKAKAYFAGVGMGGVGAPPPAVPVPPPAAATVSAPITIHIQGTNEEIARYVREKLAVELKDTIIKATSSAAPVAKKIVLPHTFAY